MATPTSILIEKDQDQIALHHQFLQGLFDIQAKCALNRQNRPGMGFRQGSRVVAHGDRLQRSSDLVDPVPEGSNEDQPSFWTERILSLQDPSFAWGLTLTANTTLPARTESTPGTDW